MFSQHKQERTDYLTSAYKAALQSNPGQPLSVSMNPIEFGESISLDKATVTRIINELIQDGYISSTRDMKTMTITRAGVNYLEELSSERPSPAPTNIISINNASNINLQQATTSSYQTQRNTSHNGVGKAELTTLVQELKATLLDVQKHLSEHQADDYSTDVSQLEKQLTRPELDKGRIYRILESLSNNFYTIPAAITANWLTEPAAQILKEGFKLLAQ